MEANFLLLETDSQDLVPETTYVPKVVSGPDSQIWGISSAFPYIKRYKLPETITQLSHRREKLGGSSGQEPQ